MASPWFCLTPAIFNGVVDVMDPASTDMFAVAVVDRLTRSEKSYTREPDKSWWWNPGQWSEWRGLARDTSAELGVAEADRRQAVRTTVRLQLEQLRSPRPFPLADEAALTAVASCIANSLEAFILGYRLHQWTLTAPHETARTQSIEKIRALDIPATAKRHFLDVLQQLQFRKTSQPLFEPYQIPDDEFDVPIDFQDPGILKLIKLTKTIRLDRTKMLNDRDWDSSDEDNMAGLEAHTTQVCRASPRDNPRLTI